MICRVGRVDIGEFTGFVPPAEQGHTLHRSGRGIVRKVIAYHDRGFPTAFDILPEARARVGDLPLVLSCGFEEFTRALVDGNLTGGVLYKVTDAPDAAAANRVMDEVRAFRC